MAESNVDEFNEYVAKIFDYLYSEFPKEVSIDPADITDKLEKDKHEAFSVTIRFLEREGFIQMDEHGSFRSNYYLNVALTSKGLAVLGASPDSLEPDKTLIQKIRDALKSGGKDAIKTAIQTVINYSITSQIGG